MMTEKGEWDREEKTQRPEEVFQIRDKNQLSLEAQRVIDFDIYWSWEG